MNKKEFKEQLYTMLSYAVYVFITVVIGMVLGKTLIVIFDWLF